MMTRLLLCTDLDRTLLPNGIQPESEGVREMFRRFVEQPGVTLVFATGRDKALVEEAIDEYKLPIPSFVIADVGTTIYEIKHSSKSSGWHVWPAWSQHIAPDWAGLRASDLAARLDGIPGFRMQEASKQKDFKLSYYVPLDADQAAMDELVNQRLSGANLSPRLVWSVDEAAGVGLLDILPARASKLHALEYLQQSLGVANDDTVFAGDSGNDLPVLVSAVPSVLVANAMPEVARQALAASGEAGTSKQLYIASGGLLEMNGNYAAGILEGVVHYHPELLERIRGAA